MVNQVHHHLYHHIFLLGLALCNHESEHHEGIICKALGAVRAIEDAVAIEEPKEEGSCNTFGDVATGRYTKLSVERSYTPR